MKRALQALSPVFCILLVLALLSSCSSRTHKTKVYEISRQGNAIIDSFVQELRDDGIFIGDTVVVTVMSKDGSVRYSGEMPFVGELIDEDGKLQLWHDAEDASINICIFNGNFYEKYGIRVNDTVTVNKK